MRHALWGPRLPNQRPGGDAHRTAMTEEVAMVLANVDESAFEENAFRKSKSLRPYLLWEFHPSSVRSRFSRFFRRAQTRGLNFIIWELSG